MAASAATAAGLMAASAATTAGLMAAPAATTAVSAGGAIAGCTLPGGAVTRRTLTRSAIARCTGALPHDLGRHPKRRLTVVAAARSVVALGVGLLILRPRALRLAARIAGRTEPAKAAAGLRRLRGTIVAHGSTLHVSAGARRIHRGRVLPRGCSEPSETARGFPAPRIVRHRSPTRSARGASERHPLHGRHWLMREESGVGAARNHAGLTISESKMVRCRSERHRTAHRS